MYCALSPSRAATVRSHNCVVGALLPRADEPALFLPTAGLLYLRQSQLAEAQEGPPVPFRTRCELLVEMGRRHARISRGKQSLVFDGGYALGSVVRPLAEPDEPGQPRVEFLTRPRHGGGCKPPRRAQRRPGQRGQTPRWGEGSTGEAQVVARNTVGSRQQVARNDPVRMYTRGARAKSKTRNRWNLSATSSEQRTSLAVT